MEQARSRSRRRHGAELKRVVLAECAEPGASVASVALKHGLNANLVHTWSRLALAAQPAVTAVMASAQFVPIPLPQPQPSPAREDIRVELRRGPSTVTLTWPVAAKDERIQRQEREARFKQALIDKLTHEVAVLRRLK
jgi:transposase